MIARHQTAIGLMLSLGIIAAAITVTLSSVFFYPLEGRYLLFVPLLVAIICWLHVGLFIVAHDAMHGSLAPGQPRVNLWMGRLALTVYAGFSFDTLLATHMAHHEAPGTDDDPDFSTAHPRHFWQWYLVFMRRYFRLPQLLILALLTGAYLLLGARMAGLLTFWAVPAIASSIQLFYFGTYRPHRHEETNFDDDHRARSSSFGWLASLLSCYHFGYHHEHHLAPWVPWWRLPTERRLRAPAQ